MDTKFSTVTRKNHSLFNETVYVIGRNGASSLCLTKEGEEVRIQNKHLESMKARYALRLINQYK